ncbi:MAG: PHP domain-containing protein [Anaerolineae bacterium]|nr:PHP domain-containing protein [Anaerolineales bacterium]
MSTLKVDLHMHTCASKDGILRPAEIINIAKLKGLDRICITDHNSIEGALRAKALDPDFVIVGEEILTTHGELLAFFVTEWVPPRLSPQETLDRLQAQGAVISVSHPFDQHRSDWKEAMLESMVPRLDAIEAFNARTLQPACNEKARAFAAAHGLPITAGSDAHTGREIGAAYQEMPSFNTAAEFRTVLPQAKLYGQLSPAWIHLFSRFNVWRGRLGLKPTLSNSELSQRDTPAV